MAGAILGRLAFVLALVALAFALRQKGQPGRANSILLSITILVGTLHSVLPLSRLADEGASVASFVLAIVVLWRLLRGQKA